MYCSIGLQDVSSSAFCSDQRATYHHVCAVEDGLSLQLPDVTSVMRCSYGLQSDRLIFVRMQGAVNLTALTLPVPPAIGRSSGGSDMDSFLVHLSIIAYLDSSAKGSEKSGDGVGGSSTTAESTGGSVVSGSSMNAGSGMDKAGMSGGSMSGSSMNSGSMNGASMSGGSLGGSTMSGASISGGGMMGGDGMSTTGMNSGAGMSGGSLDGSSMAARGGRKLVGSAASSPWLPTLQVGVCYQFNLNVSSYATGQPVQDLIPYLGHGMHLAAAPHASLWTLDHFHAMVGDWVCHKQLLPSGRIKIDYCVQTCRMVFHWLRRMLATCGQTQNITTFRYPNTHAQMHNIWH